MCFGHRGSFTLQDSKEGSRQLGGAVFVMSARRLGPIMSKPANQRMQNLSSNLSILRAFKPRGRYNQVRARRRRNSRSRTWYVPGRSNPNRNQLRILDLPPIDPE